MTDHPVIAVAWPKPDYLKALTHAGGQPRVLKPERDRLPDVLDDCDAVLLTGGHDVDPSRYGERTRHPTVDSDADRDEYEFTLARAALERDLPLLAICRGFQVLNVVAGGTLVQDIPTSRPSPLVHRRPKPPRVKSTNAHDIQVASATTLARLLDCGSTGGRVAVNSRHHQAIDRLAAGFVVSATAPDGIIEAIERPGSTYCLGVQWHPENYWRSGEFSDLFTALVEAGAARRGLRSVAS
jgi:putative glutamine amidotransferase